MSDQNQLDALIIRHIGDLEAALHHTKSRVDPWLWHAVADLVATHLDDASWIKELEATEETVWFAHRTWRDGEIDSPGWVASLWLDEKVKAPGGEDETWLASFLSVGPHSAKVALFFGTESLGKGPWKKLLKANTTVIDALRDTGFVYDPDDSTLFLPITLEAVALARAVEDDDFTAAAAPVAKALAAVNAALPSLTRLVDAARAVTA